MNSNLVEYEITKNLSLKTYIIMKKEKTIKLYNIDNSNQKKIIGLRSYHSIVITNKNKNRRIRINKLKNIDCHTLGKYMHKKKENKIRKTKNKKK